MACGLGQVSAPGSPLRGVGVPAPLDVAGFGIAGFEEAGDVHGIASDADEHVVFDDEGAHGAEILELLVGDFFAPALLAVPGIEREEPAVGRHEVEPVAIHAEAAIADQVAAFILPAVMPEFFAGAGVEGPDVVGNGEVEDSIDHERGGLDGGVADAALGTHVIDAVEPGQGEAPDIG